MFRLAPEAGRTEMGAVCFTPDGSHLVAAEWLSAGDDGVWASGYRLRIVDRDGLETHRLERAGEGCVNRMVVSPDGRTVAVARYGGLYPLLPVDCGIDLWDWRAGTSTMLDTTSSDVAFEPGGHRLASGGLGGQVEVWDLRTATLETTLDGHSGAVEVVTWSADGRWIATGGTDATIRLWDASTGTQLLKLDLEASQDVSAIEFSPDLRRIAAGQEGQGVWVWTLDRAELVRMAQGRLTRGLSDHERAEFVDRHDWSR